MKSYGTFGTLKGFAAGLCMLCLLLPTLLFAQTKPAERLNLEWVAISTTDTLRDLYYEGEEGMTKLFIPNGGFTKSHTYTGANPFRLYRMVDTPEGTKPEVAAELTLPPRAQALTLFVIADKAAGHDYRLWALPGIPEQLPPQQCRLINLTSFELAGLVDGQQFRLMPGKSEVRGYEMNSKSGVSIRLQLARRDEESWHKVINSTVGVRPNTQLTVLFRMNDQGEIMMQPIRQRAPLPSPQ